MTTREPTSPGELLRRDHARLDDLYAEVLDEFEEGNEREMRAAWTELDSGLTEHLRLEEQQLLPIFARADPREAAALMAEHDEIRRLVGELGVGIDLHLVPEDVARQFIDSLRSHAAREDALLYRWADRELQAAALRVQEQQPPI